VKIRVPNRKQIDMKHEELTEDIIKIFYKVYNTLGHGFLEKIYENSMMIEFRKAGMPAEAQSLIEVTYEGVVVGEHAADIIVDSKVIIELKAAKKIAEDHHAQLLNYLKATKIEVGLVLNFGPKPEISRKVFDNFRK